MLSLIILASLLYAGGLTSTMSVMYDKDVCFGVSIIFAIIPIFNLVYPLVYGINMNEEIKKAFRK